MADSSKWGGIRPSQPLARKTGTWTPSGVSRLPIASCSTSDFEDVACGRPTTRFCTSQSHSLQYFVDGHLILKD
eukprot:2191445-Pyramimonas_sp.AAC.1